MAATNGAAVRIPTRYGSMDRRRPKGGSRNATRQAEPVRITVRPARALVPTERLGDAVAYRFGANPDNHALQRLIERGIGLYEVYSAIAEPDLTVNENRPDDPYRVRFERGDVRVVVDTQRKVIVSVVDMFDKDRTEPRQPLTPFTGIEGKISAMATSRARLKSSTVDAAWALVKHKQQEYRRIVIDAELAKQLLDMNTANRPFHPSNTAYWREQLETGEAATTHQGMAIDWSGAVQDGQHRLQAIADTGIPMSAWVLVGADPKHFTKIDTGLNRTYGDVLGNHPDRNVLGSVCRMVYIYTHREKTALRKKVSNTIVAETYQEDAAGMEVALGWGRASTKHVKLSRSAATAGYLLIARVNSPEVVDPFFDNFESGDGPEMILRRWVNNRRVGGRRGDAFEHLAVLLKTWGHHLAGTMPTNLSWTKREELPRVARLEVER